MLLTWKHTVALATIVLIASGFCFAFGFMLHGHLHGEPETVALARYQAEAARAKAAADAAEREPAWLTVGGQRIPVYPGGTVDVAIDETNRSEGGVTLDVRSGESRGPEGILPGAASAKEWTTQAPTIDLGGDDSGPFASGGALDLYVKGVARGPMLLIGAGILIALAGAVVAFKWNFRGGLYIVALGVVLSACGVLFEAQPLWAAVVVALVALAALAYYWYRARKTRQKETTLATVVQAVDNAPPDAKAAVKSEVNAITTGDKAKAAVVKKQVDAAKKAAGH